jgi:hypothetical protein
MKTKPWLLWVIIGAAILLIRYYTVGWYPLQIEVRDNGGQQIVIERCLNGQVRYTVPSSDRWFPMGN